MDNGCKCDVPATGTAAPGSKMSCRSPRNVILTKRERVPSLCMVSACRSDVGTDLLISPDSVRA